MRSVPFDMLFDISIILNVSHRLSVDLIKWSILSILYYIEKVIPMLCNSGVARGGRGRPPPWQKLCPLSPPKWNYTLCRGLWRTAILSPSQPPTHLWAPLAAPSFWNVWLRPCSVKTKPIITTAISSVGYRDTGIRTSYHGTRVVLTIYNRAHFSS